MQYIVISCLILLALFAAPSAPHMQNEPTSTPTETPIPTLPLIETPLPNATPPPDPGDPPLLPFPPRPAYLPIILRP